MSGSRFADLHGIRSAVTGASSGIGRAIALELARAGADVIVHCWRSIEQAEQLASEIRALDRRCEVVAADFGDESGVREFAETCWQCFGGLDVLVNNAGVDLLSDSNTQLAFHQKLQKLFEVDVRSTMLLGRVIGRRMSESSGGVILNIGWDQADRGMEGDSGELFAAAKNAIMGFTKSLAVSLAPSVRVNCIAPGWIKTTWGEQAGESWQERVCRETPLGRWGTPEDIAKLARFLVSPDAAYLTGQVINVNGGAVR